ncbi:hypothetical protein BC827DRAFT_1157783 [Russula dissimulans]|nr:hypothetical protein BC827DRAFT_1157783 [Russula dissimulans]
MPKVNRAWVNEYSTSTITGIRRGTSEIATKNRQSKACERQEPPESPSSFAYRLGSRKVPVEAVFALLALPPRRLGIASRCPVNEHEPTNIVSPSQEVGLKGKKDSGRASEGQHTSETLAFASFSNTTMKIPKGENYPPVGGTSDGTLCTRLADLGDKYIQRSTARKRREESLKNGPNVGSGDIVRLKVQYHGNYFKLDGVGKEGATAQKPKSI